MSLIDRLTGVDVNNKLPVHQFWAAMHEYADGAVSESQLKAEFLIVDGNDLTDWEWLRDQYAGSTDKPAFLAKVHVLFMLAEFHMFGYNDKSTLVARITALD